MSERLVTSLLAVGEEVARGSITLDPEIARERIRRSRFGNPLRYVLELVQAAVLKEAQKIFFQITADDLHMYFDGELFSRSDFDEIYSALLLRAEGRGGQARRLLSLGLCSALQLNPAVIRVESGDSFIEMRPDEPDQYGVVDPPSALTHIHVRQRLRLGLLKRYVDRLGGRLAEEVMLSERCANSRILIEINGKRISHGHVLPEASSNRTFAADGASGVVGIAPPAAPRPIGLQGSGSSATRLSPTVVRLMKNGVWIDTEQPEELLPGFIALVETPDFKLGLSREHVIHDHRYREVLRVVLAAQLQLLAALCREHREWQSIDGALLRQLLRALLSRLDGLAPLLRWAGAPTERFPAGLIREASGAWPDRVADGGALLEIGIFHSTTGERVSLGRILDDLVVHQTVAYSGYRSREPDLLRPLVLHVADDGEYALLQGLFGGLLESRDMAIQTAWERERNMVAWLRRSYRARLSHRVLLARSEIAAPGISGEVGIEPGQLVRAPWERDLYRPSSLRLLLIKDGCLLVEKTVPFPVPGMTVAVSGDFTPSYLFDDVLTDRQMATVIEALFESFPKLIEQLTAVHPSDEALAGDPAFCFRACVLRRLLMLTMSAEARWTTRRALDIVRPRSSIDALAEFHPHPLWNQLRDWPLFETIDGAPLCARQLEEAALDRGYLAVLCPAPGTRAKRLESWAALCRPGIIPPELWSKAHEHAPNAAPYAEPPPFILWLPSNERALRERLEQQLPVARIIDAEPWLRSIAAVAAAHGHRGESLRLPDDCSLSVPLVGVDGQLGLVREGGTLRAFPQEPRVSVALFSHRSGVGNQEVYLPGGQYLSAVADHGQLRGADDLLSITENPALASVRVAVAEALPTLLDAMTELPRPWSPLVRLTLLEAAAAIFPRPAFRKVYEALRHARRPSGDGDGAAARDAASDGERDYAAILRLAVATSVDRVESVLEQRLSGGGPLLPAAIARDVLHLMALPAEHADGELEPGELSDDAEPPPGAMAWLEVLHPNTAGMPFGERALFLRPSLAAAALFTSLDGSPLPLATLIEDFRQHGHILHTGSTAVLPGIPLDRPVICDPGALLVPFLHCLFGSENVREASASQYQATAPLPRLSKEDLLSLDETPTVPHPLLTASKEERLLAAVSQELRALAGRNDRLLNKVNLAWLQIAHSPSSLAVVCDSEHFLLNRSHPAVSLALEHFAHDTQCVRFLASAVHTALSARLEDVGIDEAARFLHHLAIRAVTEGRRTPSHSWLTAAKPDG